MCMERGCVLAAAQILITSPSAAWRCCRVGCHVCTERKPSPSRCSPHGQMQLTETPTHSPVAPLPHPPSLPTRERHLVDSGRHCSPAIPAALTLTYTSFIHGIIYGARLRHFLVIVQAQRDRRRRMGGGGEQRGNTE